MKKNITIIILLFLLTTAAFAQATSIIRGKVVLTNPNGSTATITGAKVDLYRTDIWARFPTSYTDNSGEFVFAGLPVAGTYVVAVSGQGLERGGIKGIKAGSENLVVNVKPGSGNVFTESEMKALVGPTEVDKNLMAEILENGNKLLLAGQYAAAISEYEKGIKYDPNHALAKNIYLGKSLALKELAVSIYNAATKLTTDTERAQQTAKAVEYAKSSTETAKQSMKLFETESYKPGNGANPDLQKGRKDSAYLVFDSLMITALITRDLNLLPDIKTAASGYYRQSLAPEELSKVSRTHAKTLFDLGQYGPALTQYTNHLKGFPDDYEVYLPYALSSYSQALVQENEAARNAALQQSADYLQKLLDDAPPTYSLRADAKQALDEIKATYKITPRTFPPKKTLKPPADDGKLVSYYSIKDLKGYSLFHDDLQSLIERYGITGLTYDGEFFPSDRLTVSVYDHLSKKGVEVLKRAALGRKLDPADVFGKTCSLQSQLYVSDADAIQHLNCLYGIKLPDEIQKGIKELTREKFVTIFNQSLNLATARIASMKPKPTTALGMWKITLAFKEGTQNYALFLEKNGAVSGGKMFEIQGSSFDIKNFRQVGKTVSFTAMFGKVPVTFKGTIDAALMNMKGTFTGTEKGKRMTATWTAVRDTEAEKD